MSRVYTENTYVHIYIYIYIERERERERERDAYTHIHTLTRYDNFDKLPMLDGIDCKFV